MATSPWYGRGCCRDARQRVSLFDETASYFDANVIRLSRAACSPEGERQSCADDRNRETKAEHSAAPVAERAFH